jgi:hypothetical protein
MDMGRVQALASLLLSTCIKEKNLEALNTGICWAQKLGDLSLQLWGCKQRCEYLRRIDDQPQLSEATAEAEELNRSLKEGRDQARAMPEHQLLKLTNLKDDHN